MSNYVVGTARGPELPPERETLKVGKVYRFTPICISDKKKRVLEDTIRGYAFTGAVIAEYPRWYLIQTQQGYAETIHKNSIGVDMGVKEIWLYV